MLRFRFSLALVLSAVLLASPAFAASRRRAVTPPPAGESAAQWLDRRAIPLATTEAIGGLDDLAPLAQVVGNAAIVGLGDGTHGTHEFFTTKLRLLQFLVERMGFDVLAMEGSFPQFERVNAWVLGGAGDLKDLIVAQPGETYYYFWDVEELAAVAGWMRQYNLTRGSKPAVEIFGADVYDGFSAAMMVVDYLKTVDDAESQRAFGLYVCTRSAPIPPDCQAGASVIEQELEAKEAEYTARSSARRFADALHAATVVVQSALPYDPQRDPAMAANVTWARDHRSASKRVVYWAHAEHVTKFKTTITGNTAAGEWLNRSFGSAYIAFANATWNGRYLYPGGTAALPAPGADAYEAFFHAGHHAAMIVPLRGDDVHPFLAGPHHLREAGAGPDPWDEPIELRRKWDAIVYVEQTTPTHPRAH